MHHSSQETPLSDKGWKTIIHHKRKMVQEGVPLTFGSEKMLVAVLAKVLQEAEEAVANGLNYHGKF